MGMQETDAPAARAALHPRRIIKSISHASPLGQKSTASVYTRIQLFRIMWRLLALLEIPVLIVVSPELFTSTSRALLVFGGVLTYSLLYTWAALSFGDARTLRTADQIFCAALILIAHEAALIYILSFYSYASITTGANAKLREVLIPTVGLSLTLLVAVSLAPEPFYSLSVTVVEFSYFYLWALASFGLSRIMDRSSALELDNQLEEQRQDFRRRLHDDLGNTICGLHYKIQGMRRAGAENLRDELDFLARGYTRAAEAIAGLLQDINAIPEHRLTESLLAISSRVKADYGLTVQIDTPTREPHLSQKTRNRVIAIVNDAVTNSAVHANASIVHVKVKRRRGRLSVSITDNGDGFDSAILARKLATGSMGIRDMTERAAMINGRLDISHAGEAGSGTTVTLNLPEISGQRTLQGIANDLIMSRKSLYLFVAHIKLIVALALLLQVPLMEPELRRQAIVWGIAGAVFLDGVLTFFFRYRLRELLNRSAWPLYGEQFFFSCLVLVVWRADLPLFFDAAPSIGLCFSAYFLGVYRNMKLAAFLATGMIFAFILAPPTTAIHAKRQQELATEIIENAIIALTTGFVFELLRKLEALKDRAVTRAMSWQREQLSAATHGQLYSKVETLGTEIESLRGQTGHPLLSGNAITSLEHKSGDLKKTLRQILRSLDHPEPDENTP